MPELLQVLYRQMLKYARRIDRKPHLKAFLSVHPSFAECQVPDGSLKRSIAEVCSQFMGGAQYYHPILREERGHDGTTLRDCIRTCCDSVAVTQNYGVEAPSAIDRCFLTIRLLSSILSMEEASRSLASPATTDTAQAEPERDPTEHYMELREKLAEQGVDCDVIEKQASGLVLQTPQARFATGDVLHAHSCLVMGNLTRSLICLLDHDDHGSMGIVVNCPSAFILHKNAPLMDAYPDEVRDAFDGKRLWVGGDVGMGALFCIYKVPKHGGGIRTHSDGNANSEVSAPRFELNLSPIEGGGGRESEHASVGEEEERTST